VKAKFIFFTSFLVLFALCLPKVVQANDSNFIVRELNYKNQEEINKIVNFLVLEDSEELTELQAKVNLDDEEKKRLEILLNKKVSFAKQVQKDKNHFLVVCISQKDNKFCGVLFCEYSYRRKYLAEYTKVVIHDFSDFNNILLAMTHYAEKMFIALSMKKIVAHVYSRQLFNFYVKQGFLIMDDATRAAEYTMDRDTLGKLFLAIIFFPLFVIDSCMEYGVFYKDLN
jgi:hypothetical protein